MDGQTDRQSATQYAAPSPTEEGRITNHHHHRHHHYHHRHHTTAATTNATITTICRFVGQRRSGDILAGRQEDCSEVIS